MAHAIQHYLAYQHNVQRYFKDYNDVYDGVLIPLSIAISFPTGTYGFVRALCAKDREKQYAIDPRTPLFQKAWNRASVREPHEKMAAVLGEPFTTKGLTSRVQASDFEDVNVIKRVAKLCLEFQQEFRTREEDARKLAKYKKLLGVEVLGDLREPQFVIPPYFQFSSTADPWFDISMRFMDATVKLKPVAPVRPVLHFDDWESVTGVKGLVALLKEKGIRSVWLYPNDCHEHDCPELSLERYRDTVKEISEGGLEVGALFGGYFAILMSEFGLSSFSNGIGYGEWRDSGYHRGGTADLRVYIPKLHRFVGAPQAQSLIDGDPDYFASDSELLASCVAARRPVTDLELAETLEHFMECRQVELEFVEAKGLEGARAELEETLRHLKKLGLLVAQEYGDSLGRWRRVIS
jgi:hypothetical protein